MSYDKRHWEISSFIEYRQGILVRGKVSKGRQQSKRQSLLLMLEVPHENEAVDLLHMCGGPGSIPWLLLRELSFLRRKGPGLREMEGLRGKEGREGKFLLGYKVNK